VKSYSYKSYCVGLVSGALLTIAAFLWWGTLRGLWIGSNIERLEASLSAPSFPKPSKLALYGQPDWNWSLRTLDGKEVRLSEFKGKVLFITFWATWCYPCVAEIPGIQRLRDSLRNEPVAFLLITNQPAGLVRWFVTEKHITLPIFVQQGQAPTIFKTMGVPATFILSRDGTIIFRYLGAAKWDADSCKDFMRLLIEFDREQG
jgi:thiol-disulfide isomerase/thioredoxin